MRLRPSTGAFSLPRTVSGGAGNAKGVIMQPEQTHPRPRGFRRRLLGDIFHGVKRYLILGVAATLCATFLTYVTPLVVSFTVDSVIGDKTPELPAAPRRASSACGKSRRNCGARYSVPPAK